MEEGGRDVSDRGRIVLFGATGYTGELTARALVERGAAPVLAGRSARKLETLASELGGLDTVVADAEDPDGTLTGLLQPGDVLVTTVGPFQLLGEPALLAAVEAGAHYLDSTGEAPFIRHVFEDVGPRAEGRCVLLPAFGYDFVPGNLAGGLALQEAGDAATRVDICYLNLGGGGPSSGTAATLPSILMSDAYTYRDGRLVEARTAEDVRTFVRHDGRERAGLSIGASEHLSLPRVFPHLRDVNVHIGWAGGASAGVSKAVGVLRTVGRLPGADTVIERVTALLARRTGAGPGERERESTGSYFIAEAYDGDGQQLTSVYLEGPNGYTLTGQLLAWGAQRLADHGSEVSGAVGPVEAFGLDVLEDALPEVGLTRR